jgi:hypothetical protein
MIRSSVLHARRCLGTGGLPDISCSPRLARYPCAGICLQASATADGSGSLNGMATSSGETGLAGSPRRHRRTARPGSIPCWSAGTIRRQAGAQRPGLAGSKLAQRVVDRRLIRWRVTRSRKRTQNDQICASRVTTRAIPPPAPNGGSSASTKADRKHRA